MINIKASEEAIKCADAWTQAAVLPIAPSDGNPDETIVLATAAVAQAQIAIAHAITDLANAIRETARD